MEMEFHVLGPVEVTRSGEPIDLRGKQRLLLAMLLVEADRAVSVDALVTGLWDDERPAHAVHAVHNIVSQVRRALGSNRADGSDEHLEVEIIVRSEQGYRLVHSADALDAAHFERLLAEGRRAAEVRHHERAAELLGRALALWRGPAFADLAAREPIQPEARRLEGLRLLALEERVEADLHCGRHGELVEELEALVALHPLRERLWGQLMRCLYRAGRQADALAAYQRVRTHLCEELGLEPGPELAEIERAVLCHDPSLDEVTTGRPAPCTRYARTADGVNIAYQVTEDGPVDLIIVPGFTSHLDVWWETWPALARGLAAFSRLIVFDKRGVGLSDRPPGADAEQWVEDTRSVLDAAGSRRAVVLGMSAGGTVAALFAATYPERVRSLILYGSRARYLQGADYPFGHRPDEVDDAVAAVEAGWGSGVLFEAFCPSAAGDAVRRAEYGRFQRMSASPGAAAAYLRALLHMDVRPVLPSIRVPTLVLHAARDATDTIEQARYMAERIPQARLVELDSGDHLIWLSDALDDLVAEIRTFVAGTAGGGDAAGRPPRRSNGRQLAVSRPGPGG